MVSEGSVQMPDPKNDQRSSKDRRTDDRRTEDGEDRSDEDERREGDRRAGNERRSAARKNLGKIALYGLGGGLAPLVLILFLNNFQEPVRRVRSTGSRTLDYEIEEVVEAKPEEKPKPKAVKKKTGIQTLRKDLLNLAPDLYHGVMLESLISKSDSTAVDSTATVDAIEFQVKAKRWDEMAGGDKVTVLNRTFDFLKNTFPYLTNTVRLIFDDGRPNLDLRFE
jgi:hypothetical protein